MSGHKVPAEEEEGEGAGQSGVGRGGMRKGQRTALGRGAFPYPGVLEGPETA